MSPRYQSSGQSTEIENYYTGADAVDQQSLVFDEPSIDELAEFSATDLQEDGLLEMTAETEIDVKQNSIWVTQHNGEQLHLRHFQPEVPEGSELPGQQQRVFMLHGEAESGRVYYDSRGRGLAWHLARQGYEVFVADLGGRGRSLVPQEGSSSLTVHEIIDVAIPRFLQAIANTPSQRGAGIFYGCPADIWVGHGFGCVLLSAAWSRLPAQQRAAQRMVFFSGRRRLAGRRKLASWFVRGLSHPLMQRWVERLDRFPAAKLGLGSANENVAWYLNYLHWMNSPVWQGEDGFDYAQALTATPLPPVLHLAAQRDPVYSDLDDVRSFIEELGQHDARMMVFDRAEADNSAYNHLSMLMGRHAGEDIFTPLCDWLESGSARVAADARWPATDSPRAQRNEEFTSYAERAASNQAMLFA